MDEKLKPCPFCGGTNLKLLVYNSPFCNIVCSDCHITAEMKADTKIVNDDIKTKRRVITRMWNTRKYKEKNIE